MTLRLAILLLGAAALALPTVAVDARVLTIRMCGGGVHRMQLPGDPTDPAQRRDCAKACHALTERRSRPGATKTPCC